MGKHVPLKDLPSHFNWGLEDGTFKEISALEQQSLEHIETSSDESSCIECLLFLCFLYMSKYMNHVPDPVKSRKYLALAFDKINNLERQNTSARKGYLIIAYANGAHIESILQKGRGRAQNKVQNLTKKASDLMKTTGSKEDVYIAATRAFALSRLGIPKYREATKYYKVALAGVPEHVSWLFRLALLKGRENRYRFGTERQQLSPEMREEKDLYEKVLSLDGSHALARAYLALLMWIIGDTDIALQYCQQVLNIVNADPQVLGLIADIYRRAKKYDRALETFKKCEEGGTKSSRIYHHWGLVYRDQFTDVRKRGSEDNALHACQAITFFEKALQCNPTNCEALLDKARTFEFMEDFSAAKEDFEKLIAMIGISIIDETSAHFHYGMFLKRTLKNTEALQQYRTAVECAIENDQQNIERKLFKQVGAGSHFCGKVENIVRLAVKEMEALANTILTTSQYDISQRCTALRDLGWLQHKYHRKVLSAIGCYEECLKLASSEIGSIGRVPNMPKEEIMEGLFQCFVLESSWKKAEDLIQIIAADDHEWATKCKIELCISQGQQALSDKKFHDARNRFIDALDSVDGRKGLLLALESFPNRGRHCLEFRIDCAKLLFKYEETDESDVTVPECQSAERKPIPERVKTLLGLNYYHEHISLKKLREKHLKMERVILEQDSGEADDQTILDAAMEVLSEVHALLDRSMAAFKANHYSKTGPRACKYYYSSARKDPSQMASEERERLVRNDLIKKFEKDYKWVDFSKRFPALLEHLIEIQPAYDLDNNWIRAVAKLNNVAKHQEAIRYAAYNIPRLFVDKHNDGPKPVGKPVGNIDDHIDDHVDDHEISNENERCSADTGSDALYNRYRVRDLARLAALEVENIVGTFTRFLSGSEEPREENGDLSTGSDDTTQSNGSPNGSQNEGARKRMRKERN